MQDKLIRMDSPEAVLEEVKIILRMVSTDIDLDAVASVYIKTVDLFEGRFPGYRSCNTEYHDLHHTLWTFLAMARIIHGAFVEGESFSERQVFLGVLSALLHDTGYIQENRDHQGTGAKHTISHVRRSMDFLEGHGREFGLSAAEIADGRFMILCTELAADISTLEFSSKKYERLGKMLGAADLLAQMADRAYLEKLLFLYHEFREASVGDYQGEVDLLNKTIGFYDFIAHRLENTLDATDQFMAAHFRTRWDIKENLYQEAIDNQKNYLKRILENQDADPREYLKRDGIVDQVRKKYGDLS
jgi:hypothetical protein